MTEQPPINHEAFKQFGRAGYSRVAEGYDQAAAQRGAVSCGRR